MSIEALTNRLVARRTAEDEIERRQHRRFGEGLGDLHPPGCEEPASRAATSLVSRRSSLPILIELSRLGVGTVTDHDGQHVQSVARTLPHEIQVLELDRTFELDDRRRGSAHGRDPLGEIVGIGHRCGEAHQAHGPRQMDDDLLPDRSPVGVLQIVHLVQHHVAEAGEGRGRCVDHVAQHFGGHDDDRRLAVDRVVPRQEPDALGAVTSDEIVVLLIRQRLDGGRVEGLLPPGQRIGHGVLGHHRLARTRRRGHENGMTSVEDVDRATLKLVEHEVVERRNGALIHGAWLPVGGLDGETAEEDRALVEHVHGERQGDQGERVARWGDHRYQHHDDHRCVASPR